MFCWGTCVNSKQIVCNEEQGGASGVWGYFQPSDRLHGEQQQVQMEIKVIQGHDPQLLFYTECSYSGYIWIFNMHLIVVDT